MQKVIIADTPRFILTSYGNGLSYTLDRKGDILGLHWQGDDAAQFASELKAMEHQQPDRATDDILAELWNQYS